MQSICLICCYMGTLPRYTNYFIASSKKNPDIQFIVINDTISKSYSDANIRYLKINLNELNKLAFEKTGKDIKIANNWKINELKPLFGILFSDELKSFDFWGWCDLDIIWGRIRHFLTEEILETYDVITTKDQWTAGHFVLFRNNKITNHLFESNPDIYQLLNSEKYTAFEESCHRWFEPYSPIGDLIERNLPVSMYDIVKNAEQKGLIKARFKDIIREHPQPIDYIYENGKLVDRHNKEEFMYYHLITVKKIWRFYIPAYKMVPKTLIINPYGIRGAKDPLVIWIIKRALYCYQGIIRSLKKRIKQ